MFALYNGLSLLSGVAGYLSEGQEPPPAWVPITFVGSSVLCGIGAFLTLVGTVRLLSHGTKVAIHSDVTQAGVQHAQAFAGTATHAAAEGYRRVGDAASEGMARARPRLRETGRRARGALDAGAEQGRKALRKAGERREALGVRAAAANPNLVIDVRSAESVQLPTPPPYVPAATSVAATAPPFVPAAAPAVATPPPYVPVAAPTAPEPPTTPAGWYPDTGQPGQLRWWDGAAWTDHRHREAQM